VVQFVPKLIHFSQEDLEIPQGTLGRMPVGVIGEVLDVVQTR
jgi:hypothetical protein